MHRNSQKRIIAPSLIYFVTTNTRNREPYFENELLCELFIEELRLCKQIKGFKLYAFCILKDHIHLLLEPSDRYNISKVMFSIKKQFSHDANRMLGLNQRYNPKPESDQTFGRFLGRKLLQDQTFIHFHKDLEFMFDCKKERSFEKFQWQRSYHDHVIRNDRDFDYHYKYATENHLKHFEHSYPEDYRYTSINYQDMIDDYC